MVIEETSSISEAITSGVEVVCLNGIFSNKSEYIDLTDVRHNVSVYGQGTFILNSSLIIRSNTLSKIDLVFSDITIENSLIIIFNVVIKFTKCTLNKISIEGAVSPNHRNISQMQITFHNSTLRCPKYQTSFNYGIQISGNIVMMLSMSWVSIQFCKVVLMVNALSLNIAQGNILGAFVKVGINSYLRTPSIINLQHTDFLGIGDFQTMLFELHNPYFTINNCSFKRFALEIMSGIHYSRYDQVLFHFQAVHSNFVKGQKHGNGGALMISSNVKNSSVILSDSIFAKNKAQKVSNSNPGKGGAVFVIGRSVDLTVNRCIFDNNVGSDLGTGLYISEGIISMIVNLTFKLNRSLPVSNPIMAIYGPIDTMDINVEIGNGYHNLHSIDFNVISIQQILGEIRANVYCPAWYTHLVEYQLGPSVIGIEGNQSPPIDNLRYDCAACMEGFYTTSAQRNSISYSQRQSSLQEDPEAKRGCVPCPYGALCSGNNVIPRPNYWGYWHKRELVFQQCPAGYCYSGRDSSTCMTHDYCEGNRTGAICGACQEGFSVSIVTGKCTSNKNCGHDEWFWLFAMLSVTLYALWYTLKDDIFSVLFSTRTYMKLLCNLSRSKKSSIHVELVQQHMNSSFSNHMSEERFSEKTVAKTIVISKDDGNKEENLDKGYFGIVTYYVQMAAVLHIKIEFSDIDKSEPFLDKMLNNIGRFLNIELTQISFDICPITGLSMLGKHLYSFCSLFGIYISWSVIFIVVSTCITLSQRKRKAFGIVKGLESFRMKLVGGIVEIIKYTYAGFCGLIFMSLVCAKVGREYLWWYDGTNVCLENWQIIVVIFAVMYAFPFPFVLATGLGLLKQNNISAAAFVCCCLCPPVALYFVLRKTKRRVSDWLSSSKASEIVITILQGPYRNDGQNMTLYWEAVISIRRLMITGMTLVNSASIRMTIITTLCLIFLMQHIFIMPFQVKTSNYIEAVSLLLLSIASVINLLKASLTDSGVIPSGPTVSFFKTLEFFEKIFVLLIIAIIFVTEVKLRKEKRKNRTTVK